MSYYIKDNQMLWPTKEGAVDLQRALPVGTYTVGIDPMRGWYLKPITNFDIGGKIYGKTTRHADRILSTFHSRPNSTGVLLNGEKGSGKTMLAKLISQQAASQGISTLVINTAYTGDSFNTFIQSIDEPCVIVFDEFEKVFDEKEQEATLTLLDGVFPSKKLFILTCNDKYRINQHMTNRPGRIFYLLDFKGLDLEFIEEYCNDRLDDKSHIPQICRLTMMYSSFNFDMLKALVEEMNRYKESPTEALDMLNAKPFTTHDNTRYTVELTVDGKLIKDTDVEPSVMRGNPVAQSELRFWVNEDAPEGTDEDVAESDVYNYKIDLTQQNLTKVDPITGEFTYVLPGKKSVVCKMTREKVNVGYNYMDAI